MIIRIRIVYDDRQWIDVPPHRQYRRRSRPMSVYRIYIRARSRASPEPAPPPRSALLRGARINSGRGLALNHRSGARPQMVTILGWTTLDTARLPLDLRRRLQPRPAAGYSRRRMRAAIKARPSYVRTTRTIRAAVASLKLQP